MPLRILWIASLVVAVAAAGMWIASYQRPIRPKLIRARPDACWFLASRSGHLSIWAQQIVPPPPAGEFDVKLSEPFHMRVSSAGSLFSSNFNPDWPYTDMGWYTVQQSNGVVYGANGNTPYSFAFRVRSIVLAWWVIAMIALIPTALRSIGLIIRRRRIAAGRCVVCGYDLRASPERCPECGAPAYNSKA